MIDMYMICMIYMIYIYIFICIKLCLANYLFNAVFLEARCWASNFIFHFKSLNFRLN